VLIELRLKLMVHCGWSGLIKVDVPPTGTALIFKSRRPKGSKNTVFTNKIAFIVHIWTFISFLTTHFWIKAFHFYRTVHFHPFGPSTLDWLHQLPVPRIPDVWTAWNCSLENSIKQFLDVFISDRNWKFCWDKFNDWSIIWLCIPQVFHSFCWFPCYWNCYFNYHCFTFQGLYQGFTDSGPTSSGYHELMSPRT